MTEIIATAIKYGGQIICTLYTYYKILNLGKPSKKAAAIYCAAFPVILTASLITIEYAGDFVILTIILSTIILMTFTTDDDIELIITTSALAYTISFALNLIAVSIASFFYWITKLAPDTNEIITNIPITVLQLLIMFLPYRFKRLKSGMPFLRDKASGIAGVLLSIAMLFSYLVLRSFPGTFKNLDLLLIIFIIAMFLIAILILIWWRRKITIVYRERLKTSDIKRLENNVHERDECIKQLREDNERLSKIIHRDNKLIPAMELAVKSFIVSEDSDTEELEERRNALIKQLDEMASERSGITKLCSVQKKGLPETGICSIDAVLSYMWSKSNELGIKFTVKDSGGAKHMVQNIISESDFNTLLADLTENALIATKQCENKNIMVEFGSFNDIYYLEVLDSGIPFEISTLVNLGIEPASTHLDDGGSGIGMMEVYKLKKKYRASLIIEEISDPGSRFTKRISIMFNGENRYIIKTTRASKISLKANRNDIFVADYSL